MVVLLSQINKSYRRSVYKIYLIKGYYTVLNLLARRFQIGCIFAVICLSILFHYVRFDPTYGDSVPLLRIHSDNKTLDRGLPRFYDCIDNAIDHSVKKQKDPYFKAEPTLNEVLGCYYKNFVNGTDDKHKDK